ncbi:hypothetical protein EEB14_53105 [Rhodococcus sp. WS4]|nr:hypothetical protein EEB14_53105 [Rhodococcus sp. WS4]
MAAADWTDGLVYLTFGAATVTIVGASPKAFNAARRAWTSTGGRRGAQAAILDKLACGSTQAFVDELLGTPQFVTIVDNRDQRIYRLPGAWVAVEIHEGAVMAFSITITQRSMCYSVSQHTRGLMHACLGKSTFAEARTRVSPSGEFCWVGANRTGYLEHYSFGNPGGYQEFWLSYSRCGTGEMAMPQPFEFRSGSYSEPNTTAGEEPDRSTITANTLTVLGPLAAKGARDQMLARNVLGADETTVRLDVSDRKFPSANPTPWWRSALTRLGRSSAGR